MQAKDLILPAAIVGGAYLLTQKKESPQVPPMNPRYIPKPTQTAQFLGRDQSCCRWINMGGYWAYVCGPGICRGGMDGLPGALFTSQNQKLPVTLPGSIVSTGGDMFNEVTDWLKQNWYIPVGAAVLFFMLK